MYKIYKRFISAPLHAISTTFFGHHQGCRFTPTCSQYSRESIKKYGIIHGAKDSFLRLLRCNPFSSGGYDPVK